MTDVDVEGAGLLWTIQEAMVELIVALKALLKTNLCSCDLRPSRPPDARVPLDGRTVTRDVFLSI